MAARQRALECSKPDGVGLARTSAGMQEPRTAARCLAPDLALELERLPTARRKPGINTVEAGCRGFLRDGALQDRALLAEVSFAGTPIAGTLVTGTLLVCPLLAETPPAETIQPSTQSTCTGRP